MTDQPRGRGRVPWIRIAAFVIAGVCLFLALRGVDWAEFRRVIGQTEPAWLALAATLLSLSFAIRARRWLVLICGHAPARWLPVFWSTVLGYLGNAYLPARAGDLLRSLLLGRSVGFPISFVLGTTFTERLFDAVFVAMVAAFVVGTGSVFPDWAVDAAKPLALMAAILLVLMIIGARAKSLVAALVGPLMARPGWPARLGEAANMFLSGGVGLTSISPMLTFLALSVVAWVADSLVVMSVATGLGLDLSIEQAVLLIVALALSSALPSTPGFLGIFQYVAVTVLEPFGFSPGEALALIVVYQAVIYGTVTFWGGIAIWRFGGFAQLRRQTTPSVSADSSI